MVRVESTLGLFAAIRRLFTVLAGRKQIIGHDVGHLHDLIHTRRPTFSCQLLCVRTVIAITVLLITLNHHFGLLLPRAASEQPRPPDVRGGAALTNTAGENL